MLSHAQLVTTVFLLSREKYDRRHKPRQRQRHYRRFILHCKSMTDPVSVVSVNQRKGLHALLHATRPSVSWQTRSVAIVLVRQSRREDLYVLLHTVKWSAHRRLSRGRRNRLKPTKYTELPKFDADLLSRDTCHFERAGVLL